MTLKLVVKIVEGFAVVAAAVFVIMLLVNDGGSGSDGGGSESVGAQLYATSCAGCHGVDGGGGLGPKLAGQVTTDFPDIEDQIAFVKAGKGSMPSFSGDLTEQQIRQIAEYTRTELGS